MGGGVGNAGGFGYMPEGGGTDDAIVVTGSRTRHLSPYVPSNYSPRGGWLGQAAEVRQQRLAAIAAGTPDTLSQIWAKNMLGGTGNPDTDLLTLMGILNEGSVIGSTAHDGILVQGPDKYLEHATALLKGFGGQAWGAIDGKAMGTFVQYVQMLAETKSQDYSAVRGGALEREFASQFTKFLGDAGKGSAERMGALIAAQSNSGYSARTTADYLNELGQRYDSSDYTKPNAILSNVGLSTMLFARGYEAAALWNDQVYHAPDVPSSAEILNADAAVFGRGWLTGASMLSGPLGMAATAADIGIGIRNGEITVKDLVKDGLITLAMHRVGALAPKLMAAERGGASSSRIGGLASDIESHLGPNFTKFENAAGDLRFRSADGTKQIRFDLKDFHGDPKGPHINLETWAPRNRFPGDRSMLEIDNLHIYPKGP